MTEAFGRSALRMTFRFRHPERSEGSSNFLHVKFPRAGEEPEHIK